VARILLIDSGKPKVIRAVAEYLKNAGHDVHIPQDTTQLESYLDKMLPDVVAMSSMDLGTDAFSILASIRRRENGIHVGFLYISPLGPIGEPERAWTYPIDSYVTRPYTKWQLVVSIEQLLYRRIVTDEPAQVRMDTWWNRETPPAYGRVGPDGGAGVGERDD
jgi:DNA-binding response OmpR family regulator